MATTSKILPVFASRQEKPFLPSKILAHLETRIQLGHMLFIIHKFSAFGCVVHFCLVLIVTDELQTDRVMKIMKANYEVFLCLGTTMHDSGRDEYAKLQHILGQNMLQFR